MDDIRKTYIYPIAVTTVLVTILYSIGVIFTLQLTHDYRLVSHLKGFNEARGSVKKHAVKVRQSIHRRRPEQTDEFIPLQQD